MRIIGATVRYPITGVNIIEESVVTKTLRTRTGSIAFKLENGRIISAPPFVLIKSFTHSGGQGNHRADG